MESPQASDQRFRPGIDLSWVGAGCCQMSVDRVDLAWIDTRVLDRLADAALHSCGIRSGHASAAAVAAAVDGTAEDLRMDSGSPRCGALEALQVQDPGAAARHESAR